MKLRGQLMLVTALVVVIPIAGWQFVKTLEQSLRQAHEQALLDNATAMARRLASEPEQPWSDPDDGLYVHPLDHPIHLDGHGAEWERWLDQARPLATDAAGPEARLLLAARPRGRLHLLLTVDGTTLVLADPDQGPGDRVEIVIGQGAEEYNLTLAPLAPGWVEASDADSGFSVQGNWQPRSRGWTLELEVANPVQPDRLGLVVHDVDDPIERRVRSKAGTFGTLPLIRSSETLDSRLERLLPDNTRAWATTASGWVLGYHDALTRSGNTTQAAPVLFERLLGDRLPERPSVGAHSARLKLAGEPDETQVEWMSTNRGASVVVMARAPVMAEGELLGQVVLERRADELLVLANQAVLRLFGSSLVGLLLIAALLVGFAVVLSERIRRLRNRAETAVLPDGRVRAPMDPPGSNDEIGDLGRSLSGLIERQFSHQNYLRTLADKLAHELRTPLAAIRSSLDNLSQVDSPVERERYRARAEQGCRRLGAILQSMSQASRIEEALATEGFEILDLSHLLKDYREGCEMTYPDRQFVLDNSSARAVSVNGSPDLLTQMLDKLVDNAVDFSRPGDRIRIGLTEKRRKVIVQIDNPGPRIPDHVADRIFDSMVSARGGEKPGVHLGLGLYVARLIVQHHGGSIRALALPDGTRFELTLPTVAD
ncbi:hypothetical protein IC757_06965 [Wenzhouxiangella sp. AB-CW3]|uniref:ATP-binding protein n=1 Tax=Wenzhouxiangella sp. AB-CW3 TaxID=2771012 RepID=UPI00168BC5CE|nr:ATP-binding protein [Wenzhouxiangella sp. AB-CW3]QOC23854.1 hypothetical protein IC757_06965 [Wenzhouxiangella sp. AB-CW3]